jgi:hypothetical protein
VVNYVGCIWNRFTAVGDLVDRSTQVIGEVLHGCTQTRVRLPAPLIPPLLHYFTLHYVILHFIMLFFTLLPLPRPLASSIIPRLRSETAVV